MRKQQMSLISLTLAICLCIASSAQQTGRIESMKLLTSDAGWAATKGHLFWTTDGGAQWKDVTPKPDHKEQSISSVFFLDVSNGWVVLHCGDDRDPKVDDVCFEFASTTDGGQVWSVVHPKIVDSIPQTDFSDWTGYSGDTFLYFADAQHGWAILKRSLHTQASSGVMLRTLDGGHSWTQLPNDTLPMADHFCFATAKDGWVAGGGQPESDLYVTHDGGDTWSQVVVAPTTAIKVEVWPPKQNGAWPDYRLPSFESPTHGFLIGSYWDGSKPTFVLFSTTDLGASWKFERMLPAIDGVTNISDGTLFMASASQRRDKLMFSRLPLGGRADAPAVITADDGAISTRHRNLGGGYDALEMVATARGWLLADELLATSDGGATWIDITPGEAHSPRRPSTAPGKAPPN